jgi:hypothetical protein
VTGTVLTLFYPGPHAKGQLATLGIERHGVPARHVLQETLPREITAVDYARVIFEHCDLAEVDVSTVVSYCAAGQFARALAPMCARRAGRMPRMIQINPEFPTLGTLVRTIEAALRRPLRGPDGAQLILDHLTLSFFDQLQQELAETLLATVGGSGTVARDLSRMQIDWVVHLVAAARTSGPVDLADELHLIAADHPCAAECPARHLVVCDDSDEVLAAPAVIEAILGQC